MLRFFSKGGASKTPQREASASSARTLTCEAEEKKRKRKEPSEISTRENETKTLKRNIRSKRRVVIDSDDSDDEIDAVTGKQESMKGEISSSKEDGDTFMGRSPNENILSDGTENSPIHPLKERVNINTGEVEVGDKDVSGKTRKSLEKVKSGEANENEVSSFFCKSGPKGNPVKKRRADAKPARGFKVASQEQVNRIKEEQRQKLAKNLTWNHDTAFNGDVESISDPQEMFDDMVSRAEASCVGKGKGGISRFLKELGNRPLRVATMCSGTESPVLALKMISKAASSQGLGTMKIEHVFSAEIEPYKQAYISRNFGDDDLILFRDVEELQFEYATTAYGARRRVPVDVDLLIAGTSCKDCSSLNNHRQDLLETNAKGTGGESFRTFKGMYEWVKRARPAFVVLENVCGAPWMDMAASFEKINYHATWRMVDSKYWYIPHTRARGYLIATNRDHLDMKRGDDLARTRRWHQLMGGVSGRGLQRAASATVEEFLLPEANENVFSLRTNPKMWSVARKAGWDRCMARHSKRRYEEGLGDGRPITGWDPNGLPKHQDDWWRHWLCSITDRTLDVIDTQFLSFVAHQRFDPRYKALVWDLGQNVDRQSRAKFGLTGCLTPSGILLLTTRGGPVLGLETLKLQGLPVDDLLLTRETYAQLQDFAGNAMTSTVVGATMLAGLMTSVDALASIESSRADVHETADDVEPRATTTTCDSENLKPEEISSSQSNLFESVKHLVDEAHRSAQRCAMEGRHLLSDALKVCLDCGHAASMEEFSGKPLHNYGDGDESVERAKDRLDPKDFVSRLRVLLPARLEIGSFRPEDVDAWMTAADWSTCSDGDSDDGKMSKEAAKPKREKVNAFAAMMSASKCAKLSKKRKKPSTTQAGTPARKRLSRSAAMKLRRRWRDAVVSLCGCQLHFSGVRRGSVWRAVYKGPSGTTLTLVLDRHCLEWQVTLRPPRAIDEAGRALRRVLRRPVLRCRVNLATPESVRDALLRPSGWQILVPHERRVFVTISPHRPSGGAKDSAGNDRDTTESWEAQLGLRGSYKGTRRWRRIRVDVAPGDRSAFDEDVSGTYALLENCDGPMGSLHRRVENSAGATIAKSSRPLYFFLDPRKVGPPTSDSFVFAHRSPHDRLRVHESRCEVASLMPGEWACSADPDSRRVTCVVPGQWVVATSSSSSRTEVCLAAVAKCTPPRVVAVAKPPKALRRDSCRVMDVVCAIDVELLQSMDQSVWKSARLEDGKWCSVPLQKSGSSAAAAQLRWIFSRLSPPSSLRKWISADLMCEQKHHFPERCPRCAPTQPSIEFARVGNRTVPRENAKEAGPYERAIKNRPPIFSIDLRVQGPTGNVRVAVNAASLMHRACGELPVCKIEGGALASLEWRLVPHEPVVPASTPFVLTSNRHDTPTRFGHAQWSQPPSILNTPYRLRREQLRSLHWMVRQENAAVVIETGTDGRNSGDSRNPVVSTSSNTPYREESMAECVLNQLQWRAEARASIPVMIRGGVLADKVGYGKTALAVSLHDIRRSSRSVPSWSDARASLPVQATLVIVPSQLGKQWLREIFKFTEGKDNAPYGRLDKGSHPKVLLIESVAELNKLTVRDIANAEFVICAEDVFKKSEIYWNRFSAFSGARKMPPVSNKEKQKGSTSSRHFDVCYETALRSLKCRVRSFLESAQSLHRDDDAETSTSSSQSGKLLWESMSRDLDATQRKLSEVFIQEKVLHGKELRAKDLLSREAKEQIESDARLEREAIAERQCKDLRSEIEKDHWKLRTDAKCDVMKMRCPPLEMFLWNRVVVDEYTYLTGRAKAVVTIGLNATHRWCLSATPPLASFEDIKTIASVLHVNLGIDLAVSEKKNSTQSSASELFHSYREMRSGHWHAWRHDVAQRWLDRFVRQNIAEIDEIKAEEHAVIIDAPPAERAIYLELEHHLKAMEMRKGRKKAGVKRQPMTGAGAGSGIVTKSVSQGDRDARMWEVLDSASSGEEALLKRAAHFDSLSGERLRGQFEVTKKSSHALWIPDSETSTSHGLCSGDRLKFHTQGSARASEDYYTVEKMREENGASVIILDRPFRTGKTKRLRAKLLSRTGDARDACERISASRRRQLQEANAEFVEKVKLAMCLMQHVRSLGGDNGVGTGLAAFEDWEKNLNTGDSDATKMIDLALSSAKSDPLGWDLEKIVHVYDLDADIENDGSSSTIRNARLNSLQWKLRELTNLQLRNLVKEILSRVRQLRFFDSVRSFGLSETSNDCAVLSCCGHAGKANVVAKNAAMGQCVAPNCRALVSPEHVVSARRLGHAGGHEGHSKGGQYGSKLTALVSFMQTYCPVREPLCDTERVLIFVQFDDLMTKVQNVLEEAGIVVATITGTAKQRSTTLDKFQEEEYNRKTAQVLLLKLDDASASGCNLTMANHAIFVHPLLSERGKAWYTACEDQAVGRIRRYGQSRTVKVWRLIVSDTIDVDIIRENNHTYIGEHFVHTSSTRKISMPQLGDEWGEVDGFSALAPGIPSKPCAAASRAYRQMKAASVSGVVGAEAMASAIRAYRPDVTRNDDEVLARIREIDAKIDVDGLSRAFHMIDALGEGSSLGRIRRASPGLFSVV